MCYYIIIKNINYMLRNIDRYFKGKNIDYKKYYKKNNNYLNIIVIK